MYTYDEIMDLLNELFKQAHDVDEFEFCCTLLRVRGVETSGWDSLNESVEFINNTLELMETNIEDDYKLRLLVLTYCHITEMNDFYNILMNMLRIIDGQGYSMKPFSKCNFIDNVEAVYPNEKVKRIKEISIKANFIRIGEYLDYILENKIRNAFFHSDFTISGNYFRIVNGSGVNVDGHLTNEIKIEWLLPKIEMAINIIRGMIHLVISSKENYKKEEVIRGRIISDNQFGDVTLLVNEKGLIGFKS
jgi:hypothetical protein